MVAAGDEYARGLVVDADSNIWPNKFDEMRPEICLCDRVFEKFSSE